MTSAFAQASKTRKITSIQGAQEFLFIYFFFNTYTLVRKSSKEKPGGLASNCQNQLAGAISRQSYFNLD